MKCGVGFCGHCQFGTKFVCRDGPVFPYDEVSRLPDREGGVIWPDEPTHPKPTLAVFKFASCDGCQLSLLDAEDELLAVAEAIDIANFPEASREVRAGPLRRDAGRGLDHDRTRRSSASARSARSRSSWSTIGACATAGGIQALRNWKDVRRVHLARVRQPGVHRHAGPVDADVGPRPGRLRAAGLPDHQGAAARGGRPPSSKAGAPTSRRTACACECKQRGNDLRHGRGRHAVPRPGHPSRVWSDLPGLQPGVLRVLRPHGVTQHRGARPTWWKTLGVDDKGLVEAYPGLQRMGGRVQRCFRST